MIPALRKTIMMRSVNASVFPSIKKLAVVNNNKLVASNNNNSSKAIAPVATIVPDKIIEVAQVAVIVLITTAVAMQVFAEKIR